MYFILFWLFGSFIGFVCLLKLIKSDCGISNFECSDIVFFGFISLLGGPATIVTTGLVWIIVNLPKMNTSSVWCKKLTTFINKHI